MRPEVIITLSALNNKNISSIAMEKKTLEMLGEQQDLQPFIDTLRDEIRATKDTHDEVVPFYNFYLAVTLLKHKDIEEAKDVLSNAMHDFRILGWTLNEAIGEWLFSTIHFENEDYQRAQRACDSAIAILRSLVEQCEKEGKYENARELSIYLLQLDIFQDAIAIAVNSSKSLLSDYKKKVENEIEYLKRHKKRISPTLIAKSFYAYKILRPSHSLYIKVSDPKTERERKIYEELLAKVGFFEIIEQLVALKQETSPTATREEFLERINNEWDEDVKQ